MILGLWLSWLSTLARSCTETSGASTTRTSRQVSNTAQSPATYRLNEIDVADLEDTRHFPFDWQPTGAIERLRAGEEMPPIVVVQTDQGRGLGIIDGLSRTYAHWLEGKARIRAYELLLGGHS